MINKISNIHELRAEKARLLLKKLELEAAIKNDVEEIKDSLNPLHILSKKLHGFKLSSNGEHNNSFVENSFGNILNIILSQTLFRKSSFIKKLILSWLINTYGSKTILNNKELIFAAIKNLINKIRHRTKNSEPVYEGSTASENY